MPDRRHNHKNTKAYPLWNNGSYTWNKKTRQLIFMRAGNPKAERELMREPSSFYVEGDDIKHLYQVLHEHFLAPHMKTITGNMGKHTRSWDESLPHPEWPKEKRG